MTLRPIDRAAASRLQVLKDSAGTWRAVAARLGMNVGEVHHVWAGKRRATAKLLKALNLVKPRKPKLTISMTRDDARDLILDSAYLPDWLRQKLIASAKTYDKRNRPDPA